MVIVLSIISITTVVSAATTISTNIQTDGTLSVTGTGTFSGNVGIGTTALDPVNGITSPLGVFGGTGADIGVVTINNASNSLHGLNINQTGGSGGQDVRAIDIIANGPITALGQVVVDCQTCTSGGNLWVGSSNAGFTNTTTGLGYFTLNSSSASGNILMVNNNGTGKALNLHNSSNSTLIYLDGANTTGYGITGAFPALTTGAAINLSSSNSGFTGNGVISANVSNSSASGAAIYGVNAGTGAAGRFDTSKGYGVDIQSSSNTTPGMRVFMTGQNANTGLKIQSYNAPTGAGTAFEVWGGTNGGILGASISTTGNGYFAGNVGIGTTSPVENLAVTNTTANSTTTMTIGQGSSNKGSCLKLFRTDGTPIYASVAAGATTFTLSTTACANVTGF